MKFWTTNAALSKQIAALQSQIDQQRKEIRMDFSAVQTAIATLKADFDTFSADVTAKLTALAANQQNPADAATLAGVVTSLQGIDASIKAADAAVNPPSGGPA